MYLHEDRFELIARSFFEAAALPEKWPKVLDELALATGSEGVALIPFPTTPPHIPCSEGSLELLDAFIRGDWSSRNTRAQRGAKLVARNPSLVSSFVTEEMFITPEEIRQDQFYQEFLAPFGFTSFLGGSLAEDNGRYLFINFERKSTKAPFSTDEVARMNRLLPLLRSAGAFALRVGMVADQQTGHALDRLGVAAAILDSTGRIVRKNVELSWHPNVALQRFLLAAHLSAT